jgi:hypothetical protein
LLSFDAPASRIISRSAATVRVAHGSSLEGCQDYASSINLPRRVANASSPRNSDRCRRRDRRWILLGRLSHGRDRQQTCGRASRHGGRASPHANVRGRVHAECRCANKSSRPAQDFVQLATRRLLGERRLGDAAWSHVPRLRACEGVRGETDRRQGCISMSSIANAMTRQRATAS